MKSMILGTAAVVAFAAFAAAQPGGQNQQQTAQNQTMGDQGQQQTGDQGQQQGMQQNGSMNETGGNTGVTGAGAMGGALSDANLTAMIKAINDTEVKAGRLAEKRAKSKAVKNFARMMVRDHSANNTQLASVEKRIGLQPEVNEQITAMKDQAKQDVQSLESNTGTDFDSAYIDQMVKGHQDALKKLDDAIANNSGRNQQLDGFLKKTRQKVSMHLEMAQKLQSQSSTGAPSNEGNTQPGQGY